LKTGEQNFQKGGEKFFRECEFREPERREERNRRRRKN